ncbi:Na(+)/H(+) antiporter subunit C [Corynebacterium choanae]|uniref:Na(+)/H(+) antiporter subunit C n=1 Tax=Corynebacterium choanae TaxID=1862358 RepID=A0A3G6J9L7_9CORY|nr:Na(+)/H(+) antiporter subunit C [Corynebacterium choanae]AZA12724.1 Na(+)/H(+) antiporter subunit C [Corynebacterium choanae]
MSANLTLLVTAGVLFACGMYLLLDRAMTKMILGLLLAGNGVNLLVLTAGGSAGAPPIMGRGSLISAADADPLAQAMILTSIVITMAMTAFLAALAYRQYRYRTADIVSDDTEDKVIAARPTVASAAPDHDASADPTTGRTTKDGDNFGPHIFEQPLAVDDTPPFDEHTDHQPDTIRKDPR